ncbi:MAG: hypothetical protein JWM91_319 [Rhodospirillales bacterium]|nr:hypothetical protein [Rhodospirillales bacterium]
MTDDILRQLPMGCSPALARHDPKSFHPGSSALLNTKWPGVSVWLKVIGTTVTTPDSAWLRLADMQRIDRHSSI